MQIGGSLFLKSSFLANFFVASCDAQRRIKNKTYFASRSRLELHSKMKILLNELFEMGIYRVL